VESGTKPAESRTKPAESGTKFVVPGTKPAEPDAAEGAYILIDAFPLPLLLAIMVEAMGVEALLSLLNQYSMSNLPDSCWKFLASAKLLMNNERKPLPDEFLRTLGKDPKRESKSAEIPIQAAINCPNQRCNLCTLSLASDNVSSTVIVFVCGHAYHKVCLSRERLTCPVCN